MQARELIVAAERRLRAVATKPGLLHRGFILGKTLARSPLRLLQSMGIILCLSLAMVSFGCGPGYPPDYSIAYPAIAFDAQGNLFAAYQINEGCNPITYVQKITPDGERLWGERGVRLDDRQPETFVEPHAKPTFTSLVADQDGNTTIFWTYQGQVFAKKLDSEGDPVWKEERLLVGTFGELAYDSQGVWAVAANAIDTTVVWSDSNGALNLQSIDGDGNLLWSGQPLTAKADDFEAASDERGNTWLVWEDALTQSIHLQVIDRSGIAVWAEAKELQQGRQPVGSNHYVLCLAEDGMGRVMVAWGDYGDGEWRGPLEIRSVSTDGEVVVSAADRFFKENDRARPPRQMSDGCGGVFAFWTTGDSIRAQLIDPQGRTSWGENGLVVAANLGALDRDIYYSVASDQAGEVTVSWWANTAWRVQCIDSGGSQLWTAAGIAIGPATVLGWRPTITGDGAVVFSGVAAEESLHKEPCIQKVDANGSLPWGENGIRLDDWRRSGAGVGE